MHDSIEEMKRWNQLQRRLFGLGQVLNTLGVLALFLLGRWSYDALQLWVAGPLITAGLILSIVRWRLSVRHPSVPRRAR